MGPALKYGVGSLALLALGCAGEARGQVSPGAAAGPDATVQGVVVQGRRAPVVQTLIDRKVYSAARDLQSTTGTAADLLNNVPSVAIDQDGNITLRGDSNVTVLIDGKPSAQMTGPALGLSLLQMSASEIERVEVLTSPPAQYKAQGSAGVINIITKKSRKAGFSGSVQASLGDKRRYVLGASGAYNTRKLKLSATFGLRQDAKVRLTEDARTEVDPTTNQPVQSRESIDEHFLRLIPSVKLAADYDLNDKQTIGATFNHRELAGKRFFDQLDASGPPGAAVNSISDRHSNGHEWSVDGGEGIHFDQKLWRPGETLSLSAQYSVTRERERYFYTNTYPLPPSAPTIDDLHLAPTLAKTEFSADYDLPLSRERELRLGWDLEDDRNAFDNVGDDFATPQSPPVIDPAVTNHFRYHQQVNAVYGDYQAPLGAWRLDAGVRVETTLVRFYSITGETPGGRNELAAYPSLHIEREIGSDLKTTISAARRVTRPDPEMLDPFSDHQDTHNLRAGNPNLLPQDTWIYEAGAVYSPKAVTLGADAYYRFDRDSVTDVIVPVGADVVLDTKENLPKSQSGGIEFNANGKLEKQVGYTLSGNGFYSEFDARALGAAGLRSTIGLDLKASLDFHPTGADTLQVSFSRTDRRLTPQGEVSAIDQLNLGYRRQIRPDLAIVLTASDVLNGQIIRRVINTTVLSDDYARHQIGQIAYLGFIYTFGASPKTGTTGFDYDK
ncbi:MAG TPA: TonB-dependent receptor [Caulobacteraceae bacterium]|jgi:hypothetical protein|nr:TonB-dependent receptor [Caulobacteraceae bacterium]